jgi:inner membrane protein
LRATIAPGADHPLDNLAHSLAGAALARAGLGRVTPLATATLVLAANAPDVDVFAYVRGEYFALAFRRGITHGVPALAALPFAVSGAVLAWDRFVRRRRDRSSPPARPLAVFGLALVGLVTHPLLDWTNSYGMRWWLPFDGGWVYGDSLFIIDPWLWLALGSAVYLSRGWSRPAHALWGALAASASLVVLLPALPVAAKIVWSAWLLALVAARRRGVAEEDDGRRIAATLTVAAAAYVSAMVLGGALASRGVRAAAEGAGIAPVDALMVAPLPADPTGSAVLIRSGDRLVRGTHRWSRSPRARLDLAGAEPVLGAQPGMTAAELERVTRMAAEHPDARHYLAWARFPYYRVVPDGEGYRVRIADARYDTRGGSLAGLEVRVPR